LSVIKVSTSKPSGDQIRCIVPCTTEDDLGLPGYDAGISFRRVEGGYSKSQTNLNRNDAETRERARDRAFSASSNENFEEVQEKLVIDIYLASDHSLSPFCSSPTLFRAFFIWSSLFGSLGTLLCRARHITPKRNITKFQTTGPASCLCHRPLNTSTSSLRHVYSSIFQQNVCYCCPSTSREDCGTPTQNRSRSEKIVPFHVSRVVVFT
jgi:hypothetical protein